MKNKKEFVQNFKNNLNAIVKGYLIRKYKRDMPINKSCYSCSKQFGKIHREEEIGQNIVFTI